MNVSPTGIRDEWADSGGREISRKNDEYGMEREKEVSGRDGEKEKERRRFSGRIARGEGEEEGIVREDWKSGMRRRKEVFPGRMEERDGEEVGVFPGRMARKGGDEA